jgi:hypothetical protein
MRIQKHREKWNTLFRESFNFSFTSRSLGNLTLFYGAQRKIGAIGV